MPSYKLQAYSAMSPSRFAGAASFPDVALEGILEYGLCVPNLMDVSSVCRLWMKAAKEPMSWGGKKVFIEGARSKRRMKRKGKRRRIRTRRSRKGYQTEAVAFVVLRAVPLYAL